MSEKTLNFSNQAKWIWPEGKGQVNQYVQFRHEFSLNSVGKPATFSISCEGNFAAYINGQFVATGQFGDYPESPTFSHVDVTKFMKKGKNAISVMGYHAGIETFYQICSQPSVIFALTADEDTICSGEDTRYRLETGYLSGEVARITGQMGFVFEYDARKNDAWQDVDYVWGNEWKPVTDGDVVDRPLPVERPLPMLELKKSPAMKIAARGRFKRENQGDDQTVAELMQSDYLSAARVEDIFKDVPPGSEVIDRPVEIHGEMLQEQGVYFVVDLHREECGFISLDVEAPEGTVIDIAVGEHLEDMRVRASVYTRNFASRYIAGQGRQHFVHYNNRYAGRYVQLHISPTSGPVKINYAGLIPSEYPIEPRGAFTSPDSLMNKIHEVATRTLHLCMHEHYEDCPWREQALYANDSRNQALAGYYTFGEYDFPRVCFDLLGKSIREDNYLTLTAPSNAVEFAIPSFTMTWFLAMSDLLRFSGQTEFAKGYLPQIQQMLDSYIATTIDGLLPCPQGKGYWHFYDWADGLAGNDINGWKVIDYTRFDAMLNLFFVLALQAAGQTYSVLGNNELAEKYSRQADLTGKAVEDKFWIASQQAYQSYLGDDRVDNHFCEHVQSLAILAGICDDRKKALLRQKLATQDNGLIATTLSQSFYKYEALCGDVENYGSWVFENIHTLWSYMLFNGATSFWETIKGHADFGEAGSLCHGWSAIPIYFYQAYLLGVKPLENGFKKFSIAPVTNIIDKASGTVMTPSGPIKVDWKNVGEKTLVQVSYPGELEPVKIEYGNQNFEWTFNKE